MLPKFASCFATPGISTLISFLPRHHPCFYCYSPVCVLSLFVCNIATLHIGGPEAEIGDVKIANSFSADSVQN